MHVRGDGERASSLNVRGEEICREVSASKHPCCQQWNCSRAAYLVRRVAYTDIKVGQLCFDNISKHNFEPVGGWGSLYSFGDFCGHTRIKFDSNDPFCLLENFDSQITSTWAYFKDYLARRQFLK